jgi:Amt family ammonium transporter
VHVTAGFSALASLAVLGNRKDKGEEAPPHNIPFVLLGTALLWFGWFGFNAGSALSSGATSTYAAINTDTAGSTALVTWVIIDWYRTGKPNLVGACVGAVAGLATVTPAAGFIKPWAAFVMGILASCLCYACCESWPPAAVSL